MRKLSDYIEAARELGPGKFADRFPYPFLIVGRIPPDVDPEAPRKDASIPVRAYLADDLNSEVTPVLAKLEKTFGGEVSVGRHRTCDIVVDANDIDEKHAVFSGEFLSRIIYLAAKGEESRVIINFRQLQSHRWTKLEEFDLIGFGDHKYFLFCQPEGLCRLCIELTPSGGLATADKAMAEIADLILAADFTAAASRLQAQPLDHGYNIITFFENDENALHKVLKLFEHMEDYYKAAQVCEKLNLLEQAASYFEMAHEYYLASEIYMKTGNERKAAMMYEASGQHQYAGDVYASIGEYEAAARNFEIAHNLYQACKYLTQINKYEEVIRVTRDMDPEEVTSVGFMTLIGQACVETGRREEAVAKYIRFLSREQITAEHLPLCSDLAQWLIAEGRIAEADYYLDAILELDPDYENAAAIKAGLPKAESTAAADQDDEEILTELEIYEDDDEEEPLQVPHLESLQAAPVLSELTLEELGILSRRAKNKFFARGKIVVNQNTPGQGLFIVKSGELLKVVGPASKRQVRARLGPGSHAGETSLVDEMISPYIIVTAKESELIMIERDDFDALKETEPGIAIKIYSGILKSLLKK